MVLIILIIHPFGSDCIGMDYKEKNTNDSYHDLIYVVKVSRDFLYCLLHCILNCLLLDK